MCRGEIRYHSGVSDHPEFPNDVRSLMEFAALVVCERAVQVRAGWPAIHHSRCCLLRCFLQCFCGSAFVCLLLLSSGCLSFSSDGDNSAHVQNTPSVCLRAELKAVLPSLVVSGSRLFWLFVQNARCAGFAAKRTHTHTHVACMCDRSLRSIGCGFC